MPTTTSAVDLVRRSGTRPWRRRKPQHRLSGVDVTSNAPLGLLVELLTERSERAEVAADGDGAARGAVD